jgi:hypothetical protein
MTDFDSKYASVKEMLAKPGIEPSRILALVSQLKLLLLSTPFSSPDESSIPVDRLVIYRDVFEIDAVLNLKSGNVKAFVRAAKELKALYSRTATTLPKSEQMPLILSLYLVYLLTIGRADEFNVELPIFAKLAPNSELIAYAEKTALAVRDNSFSRISDLQGKQPSPLFQLFTADRVDQARLSYAKSLESTCTRLSVADVTSLLSFPNETETKAFLERINWTVAEDGVTVKFPVKDEKAKVVGNKSARYVDLAVAISGLQ